MCVGTSSTPLIFCRWKCIFHFIRFILATKCSCWKRTSQWSALLLGGPACCLFYFISSNHVNWIQKAQQIKSTKRNPPCWMCLFLDIWSVRTEVSSQFCPFLSWSLLGKCCSKDGKLLDKVQPSPLISMFEKQSTESKTVFIKPGPTVIWYLGCTEAGLGLQCWWIINLDLMWCDINILDALYKGFFLQWKCKLELNITFLLIILFFVSDQINVWSINLMHSTYYTSDTFSLLYNF